MFEIISVQENKFLQSRIAELAVHDGMQSLHDELFEWEAEQRLSISPPNRTDFCESTSPYEELLEKYEALLKLQGSSMAMKATSTETESGTTECGETDGSSDGITPKSLTPECGETDNSTDGVTPESLTPSPEEKKADSFYVHIKRDLDNDVFAVSAAVKRKNRRKNRTSLRRNSLISLDISHNPPPPMPYNSKTLKFSVKASNTVSKRSNIASKNFRKLKELDSTYSEVLRCGFDYNRSFPPLNP